MSMKWIYVYICIYILKNCFVVIQVYVSISFVLASAAFGFYFWHTGITGVMLAAIGSLGSILWPYVHIQGVNVFQLLYEFIEVFLIRYFHVTWLKELLFKLSRVSSKAGDNLLFLG